MTERLTNRSRYRRRYRYRFFICCVMTAYSVDLAPILQRCDEREMRMNADIWDRVLKLLLVTERTF